MAVKCKLNPDAKSSFVYAWSEVFYVVCGFVRWSVIDAIEYTNDPRIHNIARKQEYILIPPLSIN